jgi:hypothetical protein
MPRSRLQLTLVLASLALTPALGVAQGPAQTHTVKKGDTLWDLAQQYLGDPFKWPEIYRRNTATVKDPNLIYPDQVLIITGDVMPTAGTPADVTPARDSTRMVRPDSMAPAMPSMPSMAPGDTMASMPSAAAGPTMPMPSYGPKPMTIFNPARFERQTQVARQSLNLRNRASAVRPGDFVSTPFLTGSGGITGAGTVGRTVEGDDVAALTGPRPVQLYEHLFVTVPAGAAGVVGEKFVAFTEGPALDKGRVIIPTGVVELKSAPENGRAVAQLLTKFNEVFGGQSLMAMDTLVMPMGVFPSRVEFGAQTTLIFVNGAPVLASVGREVIFAAGVADGLVPGDQITILREAGNDSKGTALPPEPVAVVQITRVTASGSSGRIIGQTDGELQPGMKARVTAKMP